MAQLLPQTFIVLGALALIATLYYLWQSLRGAMVPEAGQSAAGEQLLSGRTSLVAEKQSLLLALRDLEQERDAGKLSQEDFTELTARYRVRAREVLRALEEQLAPHRQTAKDLIAMARGGAVVPPSAADAVEAVVAATTSAATARRGCPCGADNEADAVFCKKCGAQLAKELQS